MVLCGISACGSRLYMITLKIVKYLGTLSRVHTAKHVLNIK